MKDIERRERRMNRSEETMHVLAGLHKTRPRDGAYFLRGQLSNGREVQVFANQRKRRMEDPDFLLVEVVIAQREECQRSEHEWWQ